jgi:1,4-dihydroxy-6-naphthoate synthase
MENPRSHESLEASPGGIVRQDLNGVRLAISPCPNDTFLFEGLVGELSASGGSTTFLDIAELNGFHDQENPPDVLKISCASAPLFLDRYRLLRCGGAFADAVGPLVLKRPGPMKPGGTVLLPGWRTSAHILWRMWRDRTQIGVLPEEFQRFDLIPTALAQGKVDRGVVIHESRFTYQELGLEAEVDLGVYWDRLTSCPVPLGCLVVRKDRGEEFANTIAREIRRFATQAFEREHPVTPFISSKAAEMSPEVQLQHLRTYATQRSLDCGEEGLKAMEILWDQAETSFGPWPLDRQARRAALDTAVAGDLSNAMRGDGG